MLSESDTDLLIKIYQALRVRDIAFTSRSDLAHMQQSVLTGAAINRLIDQGYLMEVQGTIMLTTSGVEMCVRLQGQ